MNDSSDRSQVCVQNEKRVRTGALTWYFRERAGEQEAQSQGFRETNNLVVIQRVG